jgi:hypothetical protein
MRVNLSLYRHVLWWENVAIQVRDLKLGYLLPENEHDSPKIAGSRDARRKLYRHGCRR